MLFPTSLCGVLVFWLASRPHPPVLPSVLLAPSSVHSLTHSLTHSLHSLHSFHSLTHSLTHTPLTHSTHSLTHSLTHTPRACDCRRGCGARCRRWAPLSLCSGRRSTQSLQKGLRRALSPLGPPRSLQWQAQHPEPPEGAAAHVVAAGPPRSLQWQAQYPEPPEGAAARVVAAGPPSLSAVAGAVPRASRKGLRRAMSPVGPPRSLQWQAQYPEPPEGAAARVVAAGPPAVLCVTAIVICKAMVVTGCESHSLTHSLNPLTHSTYSLHSLTPLTHSLTHSYTPPPSPPSHPRPSHHHLYYTS